MSTIQQITKMIARQMDDGLTVTVPTNRAQRRKLAKVTRACLTERRKGGESEQR